MQCGSRGLRGGGAGVAQGDVDRRQHPRSAGAPPGGPRRRPTSADDGRCQQTLAGSDAAAWPRGRANADAPWPRCDQRAAERSSARPAAGTSSAPTRRRRRSRSPTLAPRPVGRAWRPCRRRPVDRPAPTRSAPARRPSGRRRPAPGGRAGVPHDRPRRCARDRRARSVRASRAGVGATPAQHDDVGHQGHRQDCSASPARPRVGGDGCSRCPTAGRRDRRCQSAAEPRWRGRRPRSRAAGGRAWRGRTEPVRGGRAASSAHPTGAARQRAPGRRPERVAAGERDVTTSTARSAPGAACSWTPGREDASRSSDGSRTGPGGRSARARAVEGAPTRSLGCRPHGRRRTGAVAAASERRHDAECLATPPPASALRRAGARGRASAAQRRRQRALDRRRCSAAAPRRPRRR